MHLIITPQAEGRCLYDELIPLHELGRTRIQRGSHVEPDAAGQWWTDLSPVDGPLLGPFMTRSIALAAEVEWLKSHWLTRQRASDEEAC